VNNNGNITFNARVGSYTPSPFPVSSQPMAAAYWGDVDTRGTSNILPEQNLVYYRVIPGNETDDGRGRIVATWYDVGYYSSATDKLNSFQAILIDQGDGFNWEIEYRYDRCEWTTGSASGGSGGLGGTPAQTGFDAGNGVNFYSHPFSQTAEILNLCTDDTVQPENPPGILRFNIPGCNFPDCGNGTLDDGEECDDGNFTPNDGCTTCTEHFDEDDDGFFDDVDCDDNAPGVFPGALEECDGIDNDCDGVIDNGLTVDNDFDGAFGPGSCGEVTDCNDNDGSINPAAAEQCDGIDNNCNDAIDEGLDIDLDQDGAFGLGSCTDVTDCDDSNPAINPAATESCDGLDNNCNDEIDEGLDTDADEDGQNALGSCTNATDCDDTDPNTNLGADELCDGMDNDCTDGIPVGEIDQDGDFFVTCDDWSGDDSLASGDCNDNDATTYAGADELCDGIDNDCDEAIPATEVDDDGDFFIDCDDWLGQDIYGPGDCNDDDATVYPGADELCDGIDNDCDGVIPEDETDDDGDFFIECDEWLGDDTLASGDCDDDQETAYPGAEEICDGLDNDCNGEIDENLDIDWDEDGYFAEGSCQEAAACNDDNDNIHPGHEELCNGFDDNCDGNLLDGEVNEDGDDFLICEGDCDDTQSSTYPGAPELCDTIDNNCDGNADEDFEDTNEDGVLDCLEEDGDEDGQTPAQGDCDDTDSNSFAGATELCDGLDNDCDGLIPVEEQDVDEDGISECQGDCDDADGTTFPGADELCDGLDNDCDGVVPDDELDADGDGVSECDGDCDDDDATAFPGAEEVIDGVDNDCDGEMLPDEIDDGLDPIDTGDLITRGCGCDSSPASPSALFLLLGLLVPMMRRRR
jgi:MYXO-CTERM domain-containing protein